MPRARQGRFLRLPYDWRRPTRERLRRAVWDPDEARVLVPKALGWGYGVTWPRCGGAWPDGSGARADEGERHPFGRAGRGPAI